MRLLRLFSFVDGLFKGCFYYLLFNYFFCLNIMCSACELKTKQI